MATFQINITNRCNLACPFCYAFRNNQVITKEIMDKAVEFIINKIKLEPKDTPHNINFSGGELFTGAYELIPGAIRTIKERCSEDRITYTIQSNLTALRIQDNEKAEEIISLLDSVGTSLYDLEIVNKKQKQIFDDNIKYIQRLNKKIEVMICVDYALLRYGQTYLYEMLVDKGIYNIEFERLSKPMELKSNYKQGDSHSKPSNEEQSRWLTVAYKEYKEFQKKYPNFHIYMFDCMENAVNGIYHYEHSRNCQKTWYTILPNGDIGNCPIKVEKPFYNLLTKKLDIDKYNEIVAFEENVNPKCLDCVYYKYCKGDCCNMEWDNTGCPTPYKIFDLIEERNKIDE